MHPKRFYQDYLADNGLSPLSQELIQLIRVGDPRSVLEFGAGTGKHLKEFPRAKTFGIDLSLHNLIHANVKNGQNYFAIGDEDWLPKLQGFDVAFTCSVLDHIEDVDGIIKELKRIAKRVYLAETNDTPGQFYYPHDYESYGFRRTKFEWKSTGDGATYHIWVCVE